MTVVSQPAYEIGRQAAELMLERLAGHSPAEPRTIVLPSELIIRRSTAPPSNEPASEVLTQLAQMENRA
jgi:DNA-binding LacI/PurR family transcriptional regulator